jgi:hypothetical protein
LYNNIFYFEDAATWGVLPDNSCVLSHNLFYNIAGLGTDNVMLDPLFVDAGQSPYDIDMTDPERLSGYMLQDNSPAIDAGKFMENNGGLDFWGNPLHDDLPDIGAYEKQD